MGAGESKTPVVGLSVNPRVQYTDHRSKNENKALMIDAPVLAKLEHGTIRYRYIEEENDKVDRNQRIEKAHEGPERGKKEGYFYHSRLDDFSHRASSAKENPVKFCYVYKGPNRAKQKQVYYVFGKGLKRLAERQKEAESKEEQDTTDAQEQQEHKPVCKIHGHSYFDLEFLDEEEVMEASDDEDDEYKHTKKEILRPRDDNEDNTPDVIPPSLEYSVKPQESIEKLKRRISVKLFKPVSLIHVFYNGDELSSNQVTLSSLQPPNNNTDSTANIDNLRIRLVPMKEEVPEDVWIEGNKSKLF